MKPTRHRTARTDAERKHRVRRIRAKVRDGTYENALKLSVAVERLLRRLKN